MTVFDVHTNRIPYPGSISYTELEPVDTYNHPMLDVEKSILRDLRMYDDSLDYLHHNQRMHNRIYSPQLGQEYYLLKIANLAAPPGLTLFFKCIFVSEPHSYLKASIGSMADALRAGTNAASAAAKINNAVAAMKRIGFCTLPSAHRARSLLNARLSTTPPASPPITLVAVDANTSRSTCAPFAPSAMRMPNSFVLCATV